ncbi:MAG: chromosome partitioning protein ParA, partial [Rhodospirillales bacterium]|nr:chromosome partitioning protein ParA [Rhodospirillales bacterium]
GAVDPKDLSAAEDTLNAAETAATQARAAADTAETDRQKTAADARLASENAQAKSGEAARLEAEEKALAELLEIADADLWPPVIDIVTVAPGFETALGAALGDDLTAATDEAAPVHWRIFEAGADAPALPHGAVPLAGHVDGPDALKWRLSQIGVVEDEDAGWRLAPSLKQGQRLVSKAGAFWRWDGFSATAEAPSSAAARLQQRNRLADIRDQLDGARKDRQAGNDAADNARKASDIAAAAEAAARADLRRRDDAVHEARAALAGLQQANAEFQSRLSAREESAAHIANDLKEAESALGAFSVEQEELADPEPMRLEIQEARTIVTGYRSRLIEAQSTFETLKRRADDRKQRVDAIQLEIKSWEERKTGATKRLGQLTTRKAELDEEQLRLQGQPTELERRRNELLELTAKAEIERRQLADVLAEGEAKLAAADKKLREAEAMQAGEREQMVRAEAAVEQTKQASIALGERMSDRVHCAPEQLRELSGLKDDAVPPELDAAEKRVERLLRERESMGPVNLRAETESQELEEQIDTLTTERDDLLAAIDKLRRGISELNREGRKRLLASFKEVDTHFQELFVRLFGGGRAHLTLTESDDPLEAGLEIMASPPGKRLQVLSLLSGGEQALTALSLLFAVFMNNPAPICVLDEVDAPLDDANVDRFCSLVDEIAHSLSTRFLVVTHHRMTMARVDRLFGVTMGEQGVSQLVSVDLGQAMEMRATA